MFESLNEKNIDLYAAKMYSNPQCISVEEFHDDMKRIKYIKRLFNRYNGTGEIKERLLLNHIVIFYNVFSVEAATRILFCKLDNNLYSILKTFLVYFGYMPERVFGINGSDILSSDIAIDNKIAQLLRKI
jgi:hypothetical protein